MICSKERDYIFVKSRTFNALYNLRISLNMESFSFIDNVLRFYLDSKRKYHSISHIRNMLDNYDLYYDNLKTNSFDNTSSSPELELAIIFHDIIYVAGANNNEEQSALCLVNFLKKQRYWTNFKYDYPVENSIIKQIKELILATKDHKAKEEDSYDKKFIICMDLLSLAEDWQVYKSNNTKIREEYYRLSWKDWSQGRIEFINNLLLRQKIFPIDKFHERFEIKAKNNLIRERQNLLIKPL